MSKADGDPIELGDQDDPRRYGYAERNPPRRKHIRLRTQSIFQVNDSRTRICRKCEREIERGEWVKSSLFKKKTTGRNGNILAHYLCNNCYVDAHGNPLLPGGRVFCK